MTKSSTEEKVQKFVQDKSELNYPVAKENGKIAPMFNVSGIPAAAVVRTAKSSGEVTPTRHHRCTLGQVA